MSEGAKARRRCGPTMLSGRPSKCAGSFLFDHVSSLHVSVLCGVAVEAPMLEVPGSSSLPRLTISVGVM